jgi:hypothetical protein
MARTSSEVLSHWHTLFEDFRTSPQDFYVLLEAAIRRRNLPDVEMRRVLFKEGGIASANREYLRVKRHLVVFDVCSALYGKGQFFSWWLAKLPPKYGLFAVLLLGLITMPLWFILSFSVLQGCGFMVATIGSFLGFPIFLLLLGFGVEKGLVADEEYVLSIPIIGFLYSIIFNPVTYFRLDTAYMFRDSVRAAVNEVLNEVRQEKGLRLLSDEELSIEGDEGAA